jgi:ribose 5-phosphate isomerase A
MALLNTMDSLKQAVAESACSLVKDGQVLGLGTGSTVYFLLEELARRILEEEIEIVCIPTSKETELLARERGIPVGTLEEHETVSLAIDGADQVSKNLDLIKGGGAAHTREKIVASLAERFVVIVDEGKLSERLSIPVPVEVLPFSWKAVFRKLEKMKAKVALRYGSGKVGPVVTDNGNYVLDADFGVIEYPRRLEASINLINGVVENGVFPGMAQEVHVGTRNGVNILIKPG